MVVLGVNPACLGVSIRVDQGVVCGSGCRVVAESSERSLRLIP